MNICSPLYWVNVSVTLHNTVFHAYIDLIPDTLRYGACCDYIHTFDKALLILKLTNYFLEAFVVLEVS